ncbi:DeoR family transcriptional regulator, partial [Salmonella enterica subsp. enterica serovar Kentucky]|nr:DeoR family transcriptional regulator [Salmonella enterica subsp. enterica serovar Kentucky]
VVKVSNLAKSLKVTKETIRSDLNELAGQGYLTRCHGGAFITLMAVNNDLSHFPVPFFDPRDNRPVTLPIVFADMPDLAQQQAAS